MTFFEFILDILKRHALSLQRIFAALIASFMLSYAVQLVRYGGFGDLNEYYNHIEMVTFYIAAAIAFAFMTVITYLLKNRFIIPWALMISTMLVSLLFAVNYTGDGAVYFALGVVLVDFLVVAWEARGDKLGLQRIKVSRKASLYAAITMFVVLTVGFGYITSLKYRSYYNFTFDFGIFSQMFERMAVTGVPYTTVERSYMMSHFGVHFSPIFYLFLPGYFIFRSPLYLFYIQAAGVAAGVFAVYLIAGKLKLSGKMTLALELIYAFYPCLMNGTFYDFHENKFLTTIIMFLFYFILKRKLAMTYVFSLLLLTVKEDAAVYLMVIAVYVIIHRKETFRGIGMLSMALIYFLVAQYIVSISGTEGVMLYRLEDFFINGEQGFGSVIKAIFYDMGYLIQKVFTADKLPFLIWMFLPVMLTPFMDRRIGSLVLLLPILPINLMQSWVYQYNIDYQYTYGVAAMVLFCAMMVMVKQLDEKRKPVIVIASVCACVVMSVTLVAPKIRLADTYMKSTDASRPLVNELINEVPTDATVTASDSIVPHLYKVEWLYTVPDYYPSNRDGSTETDYFVVDTRFSDRAATLKEMMGDNYDLVKSAGFAELYKHK